MIKWDNLRGKVKERQITIWALKVKAELPFVSILEELQNLKKTFQGYTHHISEVSCENLL